MKTLTLPLFPLLGALASGVFAEPVYITVPRDPVAVSQSQVRAEARAEEHIRRLSGYDEQLKRDRLYAVPTEPFLAAKARYEAMLASPGRQVLVKRLTESPNAEVVLR